MLLQFKCSCFENLFLSLVVWVMEPLQDGTPREPLGSLDVLTSERNAGVSYHEKEFLQEQTAP